MNYLVPSLALLFTTPVANAAPAQPLPTNVDELIEAADLNNDGQITRAEFLQLRSDSFPAVDSDSSGALTFAEFKTVLNSQISRFAAQAFRRVDANNDGKISQEEWNANPPVGFDKADTNKDGILTAQEREAKRYR